MRDRALDRPAPFEAEITVARPHRHPRDFRRLNTPPMHVALWITPAITETRPPGLALLLGLGTGRVQPFTRVGGGPFRRAAIERRRRIIFDLQLDFARC